MRANKIKTDEQNLYLGGIEVNRKHRNLRRKRMSHEGKNRNRIVVRVLAGILAVLFVVGLGASCSLFPSELGDGTLAIEPTPTVNQLFSATGLPAEAKTEMPAENATTTSAPNNNSGGSANPQVTSSLVPLPPVTTEPFYIPIMVYNDNLNSDWLVSQSRRMSYDLYQWQVTHEGSVAIATTPQGDFGTLYFTVANYAESRYFRDQIVGLRFWLNGGDDVITPQDLAVTIVGSNDHRHWVEGDTSVSFPAGETFSETRLSFLGFNQSIPPNTWVEVEVWFDQLQFDPQDFKYITGFYIKNDPSYLNTFYVDDIALILESNE